MDVFVLDTCEKELKSFSKEVLEQLPDLIAKLKIGVPLTMPVSKKMDSIGKSVYELRLKDRNGIYRIIYFIKKKEGIYLVHAFNKKTQKTPKKNLDLAKKRIRRLM